MLKSKTCPLEREEKEREQASVSQALDKYVFLRILGEGTEGRAFLCACKEDLKNRKPSELPLKVVKFQMREAREHHKDTEIQAVQRLPRNPAFIRVLEVDSVNKMWMTMDFCDGGDMGSLMLENSTSASLIWHVFIELVEALAHLHSLDIAHTDLFEGNILVKASDKTFGNYPRLVLADFGKALWMYKTCSERRILLVSSTILTHYKRLDVKKVGDILHRMRHAPWGYPFPERATNGEPLYDPQASGTLRPIRLEGKGADKLFSQLMRATRQGTLETAQSLRDKFVARAKELRSAHYRDLPTFDGCLESRRPSEQQIKDAIAAGGLDLKSVDIFDDKLKLFDMEN